MTSLLTTKVNQGSPASLSPTWQALLAELQVSEINLADLTTYAARQDGQVIRCCVLCQQQTGNQPTLKHLWVRPDMGQRGVRQKLLNHALSQTADSNALCLEIEAEPENVNFYHNMGAKKMTDVKHLNLGLRGTKQPLFTSTGVVNSSNNLW